MRTNRSLVVAMLVIVGLLVVACDVFAPAPATPTVVPFPTYTPGEDFHPTSPIPYTPAPSPMVGERVIRYEVSGGLTTGMSTVLEIGPTGQMRVTSGNILVTTTVMLPDRLAALQARFAAIHFSELHDTYNIRGQRMDDESTQALNYTQNKRTKRVQVTRDDRQVAAPPSLDSLIYDLNQTMWDLISRSP